MTTLTFSEELDRKLVETAELLILRQEQGVYTNREFRIAIETIWNLAAGLSDETAKLMEIVSGMGLSDEKLQIVVSNGTDVYIIGRNKLTVTLQNAKTFVESGLKVFDTEADAVDHVRKLRLAFHTKGYKTL